MFWVPDDVDIWTPGTLISEDKGKGTLKLTISATGKSREVNKRDCLEINDPRSILDAPHDLISLAEVNEASILSAMKKRFLEKMIYTSCGSVLMVVNPFARIENLYGPEKIREYENIFKEGLIPHVYVTSSRAFSNMCNIHKDQSILIRSVMNI